MSSEKLRETKVTNKEHKIKGYWAESLFKVGLILNSTLRLEEVVEIVIDQAMVVLEAEAGTLWLLEEDGEHLVPLVARGPKANSLKGLCLMRGEGLAGMVADTAEPVLVSAVRKDPRWARRFDTATGFETRTLLCVPLVSRGKNLGCLQLLNKTRGRNFNDDDLKLCLAFASQAAIVIENSFLYTNQKKLFISLIKTLASVLDARDSTTRGHSERVSKYSLLLARKLGFDMAELETVEQAALLHDIGKIGLRDSVLLCPGPLNEEKKEQIRAHPSIGAQIIEQMEPKPMAGKILEGVLYHQERYDGTGYPTGIKGDEIPLIARIIAIADAFDAITSDRPYRDGKGFEEAVEEIKQCAGTQFDPALSKIFIEVIQEYVGAGEGAM